MKLCNNHRLMRLKKISLLLLGTQKEEMLA